MISKVSVDMDVLVCEKEIKGFLDKDGKLYTYPAKFKKQLFALRYLASKFDHGRQYTEKEVNALLNDWHTFGDWALLRRDLCDRHFIGREPDGSRYWLEQPQPTLASFALE